MSTNETCKVLLVDDNREVLEGLEVLLEDDYDLLNAASGKEAIDIVKDRSDIAVAVLDIKMSGMNGIEAGRKIREINPDISIIFHTGYPGQYSEEEIEADEKPFDYIVKGDSLTRLTRSIKNGMDAYLFKGKKGADTILDNVDFGMIGKSQPMREVFKTIRKVAPTESKIMILGQTGTGKELTARAIHKLSRRHDKRLVIFNCNHKAPDLVESELFGHSKGAFTGAVSSRIGLFEYADGGTVFLDEIGDLDISTQAKILRVLETGEFHTVGDTPELKKTDIRIICATHHNLQEMVEKGTFREDLYYRLKGVVIELPSLKERKSDIPLLIAHFTDKCTIEQDRTPVYFDNSALDLLKSQDWPGNVRQLQDSIEALIVLSDSDLIIDSDVRHFLGLIETDSPFQSDGLAERTKEFRRNCIIEALRNTNNNINAAARELKVDPSNLRKWIKSYDIVD